MKIEDMRKPKGEAIIDLKPGTVFEHNNGVWIRSSYEYDYLGKHYCFIVNLETGEERRICNKYSTVEDGKLCEYDSKLTVIPVNAKVVIE